MELTKCIVIFPVSVCLCMQSKIDERQILEGIPEERKKELEQKMKWDRGKQTRRPIHPGRTNPSKPLVRRSSIFEIGTRPKTLDHVVTWFREKEAPRGRCRERDGTISLWFHGNTPYQCGDVIITSFR